MALLPILEFPDPRLRTKAATIDAAEVTTPAFQTLLDDMFETMYDAPGIGLAAIQVGEPLRVVTIDLSKEDDEEKAPQVFLNPEILSSSDERSTYEEGCLSIPDYYAEVERPARVTVRYLGLDGGTHEIEADGLLATCLQHEIDHLNGVLFIDHISKLKRDMVIRKFSKASKRGPV